jgi:HTH-type transcriptional regulator/antitoxin HigA
LADEIDLLTLLIEKWDSEHNDFIELNPIELIKALMKENHLRARDLVEILGLSKGTVSKILNCQKGLSKGSIRILAQHFKVHQEALNKSYELVSREKNTIQKAS